MKNDKSGDLFAPETPLEIACLSVEGMKRVRQVEIKPVSTGLTKLGGNNRQGKTSILDALGHALLGAEVVPTGTNLINDDAEEIPGSRKAKARTRVRFSDGTVVERRLTDANSRTGILEITLPNGCEGTLQDLKNCISKVALVPTKMESMTERERLKHLLGGVNVELDDLEEKLDRVNKERQALYQEKEMAQKHANDLPEHEGIPTSEVNAGDVMNELQAAMDANSENKAKRQEAESLNSKADMLKERLESQMRRVSELEVQLEQAKKDRDKTAQEHENVCELAVKAVSRNASLKDIATDELKQKLNEIDEINRKVRENQTKEQRNADAAELRAKWNKKEQEQNDVLREMKERIENSNIPVDGLGIDEKLRVTFSDQPWANCSGMQKKVVEAAIASLYQPHAKFILVDGLEAMDEKSQEIFHKWAVSRNLQIIGTEVRSSYDGEDSTDGIARFVIHDGRNKE